MNTARNSGDRRGFYGMFKPERAGLPAKRGVSMKLRDEILQDFRSSVQGLLKIADRLEKAGEYPEYNRLSEYRILDEYIQRECDRIAGNICYHLKAIEAWSKVK